MARVMSLAEASCGGRPFRTTFTVGGTLNQTFPKAKAWAISTSPMPCPKAPMAPRMLAWESVETKVDPGTACPSSMARWVPIPASIS